MNGEEYDLVKHVHRTGRHTMKRWLGLLRSLGLANGNSLAASYSTILNISNAHLLNVMFVQLRVILAESIYLFSFTCFKWTSIRTDVRHIWSKDGLRLWYFYRVSNYLKRWLDKEIIFSFLIHPSASIWRPCIYNCLCI